MHEHDIKPEEVRDILTRTEPETLRRVLPREFISLYIRQYLREVENMMKSFQAILTFPTHGRDLPGQMREQMQEQFNSDIQQYSDKLDGEVSYLLRRVRAMKVLQSHIMMRVISDKAFPFCVLNTYEYDLRSLGGNDILPCYVTLWAQRPKPKEPISVWLQLVPCRVEDWGKVPAEKLRTDKKLVRLPTGQVDFCAFNTVASVILYDLPTEAEATLNGKSLRDMIKELKDLRSQLVRQKGQRGNFLHIVWSMHKTQQARFININEAEFAL